MLKKKYYDLKAKRDGIVSEAENALNEGKQDVYAQKMAEIEAMNSEICKVEKLLAERDRFASPIPPAPSVRDPEEPESKSKQLKELRSSPEYARAWLKSFFVPKGAYSAELDPLYKAMTISGGDPAGSDGGFLVPMDFETTVHKLAKDYLDLSTLINVETTSVNAGWRVVETSATRTALRVLAEGQPMNEGQKPTFKRVDYSCKSYGEFIPISRELANDAQTLMRYLADWFAPKYVQTKNELLLGLLKKLSFAPISGATDAERVRSLKTVLNVGLNTAHSRSAVLLTNQNGYNEMDNWVDGNGRALLVPDLSGDFYRFKNRPVVYGDNDLIADHNGHAPLFIGSLRSFATLFLREGMTVEGTNVGGDAWRTGGTEVRCVARMDMPQVDENAVKFCGFTVEE